MEDTLNRLKFLDMLSPRGIHIPNCDRKGFYKKKQVSAMPPAAPGAPGRPRMSPFLGGAAQPGCPYFRPG